MTPKYKAGEVIIHTGSMKFYLIKEVLESAYNLEPLSEKYGGGKIRHENVERLAIPKDVYESPLYQAMKEEE